MLIVSGRPQVITDQLGKMDALVASWLPGSEGAGVADVLFGRRPFTGRLSMTWPRSEAQVPINVGDANYQPLFPFGWGLRTDSSHGRLQAAARGLQGGHADRAVGAGSARPRPRADRDQLGPERRGGPGGDRARPARRRDGQPRARPSDTGAAEDAIVSVARDVAQAAVVAGRARADWARLIADADHALLAGDAPRRSACSPAWPAGSARRPPPRHHGAAVGGPCDADRPPRVRETTDMADDIQRRANRLLLRLSGRRLRAYSILRHVGRTSGREYRNPVSAYPLGDGFVIAVLYGTGSQWVRNVLATGRLSLRTKGRDYPLERPELIPAERAIGAFPPWQRAMLRARRIQDFFVWAHRADPVG